MRSHRASRRDEPRSAIRSSLAHAALCIALSAWCSVAAAEESGPRATLAAGPYAVLQGVMRKTVLKIEVARVQIRVDETTQRKLAELTSGRKHSDALADGVVAAVMDTRAAVITSELRRDVPFERYSETAYDDLRSARDSGLISEDTYWSLAHLLPEWMHMLRDRGVRKGDRFMCRMQPGSMRVVYRTNDGRTLVDRTIANPDLGRAVLASYLAPTSSFRKELVHSLFR
jgi:hypothetical protein